jgi:hypothetical protein
MGSIAKQKSSTDFKPLDEGTHTAICNAVIDIGLQSTPWGTKEQVWLRFEVPAERVSYIKDGLEVEGPQIIWARYNKTLTKKANLRKDLDAWRGKEFTTEELGGFDLFRLVGKPCLITVVHNHGDDRTYANIAGITKILRNQQVPDWELNAIRFSPEDTDQYEDVPEWLQEKFDSRLELPEPEPAANDHFVDDDLEDIGW